ncbi:hypothetical protein F4808DRAFT_456665 [Astrocystis sublimbata]|nr:hypothetical protein F4808DRAFT_456665 [Astrocystis sublimbata]
MSDAQNPAVGNGSSSTPSGGIHESPTSCWDELVSSLNAIKSRENFASVKTYPMAVNPVIEIDKSIITLPLTTSGADIIKRSVVGNADNASEGAMDPSTQGTWKLHHKNFKIKNPDWPTFLELLLDDAVKSLDIPSPSELQPFELILIEQSASPQAGEDM